jgi:hypothetical protein
MNSTKRPPAKGVSVFAVAAVFAGFALFLLVVKYVYLPHQPPAPHTVAPEQLPADQAWKATPEARKAYLAELRAKEQKQAVSYAWIDQAKGVVQLPIDRAMDLTLQDIRAAQQTRQIRDIPENRRGF